MPLKRDISFLLFTLFFVLFSLRCSAQWEKASNNQIDTSEYLPYVFANVANYNLMVASGKGYSSEIVRLIQHMGADVNSQTDQGVTPLIYAVANNKPEAVSTLLTFEPNIDGFTIFNENALLIAAKNGYFEVTEILIRAGASINAGDRYGAAPIHYATVNGFADIVDMLIYYDADINYKTSDGSTPLMASVWAGNTEIADLLIRNGARVEEKDNDGNTPFLLAAWFDDTVMMNVLYRHGANVFETNDKGQNALTLAIMSETEGGVEYLLGIEKNWSGPTGSITDPYAVAAGYGRKEVLELLKKNNVPGKLRYGFDHVTLSVTPRFSTHDSYAGGSLSFTEPYLNLGFMIGIDTKLWYTRVLMKESENTFYQYFDRGSLVYAGFFKNYRIGGNSEKLVTQFSPSLLAGYSFGNRFKGSNKIPESKIKIIPAISFNWTFRNFTLNAGAEYIKTDFYKIGPVWFRAGVGYNYYFNNIRSRMKYPKWY